MSRIGANPVLIPENVEVSLDGRVVTVKGPNGEVSQTLPEEISVEIEEDSVRFVRPSDDARDKAMHGLSRSLVANMVEGVTDGFAKSLEIVGVGYRAETRGNTVVLQLGFSHPVEFEIPEGIEVRTPEPTRIEVSGADKQLVGQVAAELRGFRPAEPYKGKGIRYEGEHIRRKAGKTGV
ncbi:MAG: 50S ribosomal protein L6 [Gemmatimonadota bacterium]|nr:50S ribosomal protein L6 [Gemmatimonadota bacterium]